MGQGSSAPARLVILRQAKLHGCRPDAPNARWGIRRNQPQARERFCAGQEIGRPDEALTRHVAYRPVAAAIIRLSLLTGC